MSYANPTDDDKRELKRLNKAVEDALDDRTAWLDRKMLEYSELKPGDDIYDLSSGVRVGVVSELYRLPASQNRLYDTHLSWDYQYETRPHSFDNTSRQYGKSFGTKAEAIRRQKQRLENMEAAR